MIFALSQRNKPILFHDGKLYNLVKIEIQNRRFRCYNRTCRGFLVINENNEILESRTHTCQTEPSWAESRIILAQIKERSVTTAEPFSNIYTTITSRHTPDALAHLPPYDSIRDSANKLRNKENNFVVSAMEDIPESLQRTLDGKRFLQYDSGVNDNGRFIIFFNGDFLDILKDIKKWVCDGTFRSVPSDFYQLLTIQGSFLGNFMPLIFVLMKDKSQSSYTRVFTYLRNTFEFSANFIVTDFEMALINSSVNFGNNITRFGCAFHFGQTIWRRIQHLGLTRLYREDADFRKIIRMFLSLSYFSCERKMNGFNYILNMITSSPYNNCLSEFINYFKLYYIGIDERDAVFPVRFWDISQRIMNNIPRTTNSLEGWHRGFNNLASIRNPNISRFINLLTIETEKIRGRIARIKNGNIDLARRDYEKEYTIRTIIENQNLWTDEILFSILEKKLSWKLE